MSANSDSQRSLESYVGRQCVYIELADACVCTLEAVSVTAESFSARFKIVPDSFKCRLRVFRTGGEDLIESVLDKPPFDEEWSISAFDNQYYLEVEKNYWYLGFLWGGGIRVFFQSLFVGRFSAGDAAWIDEHYDGDDEEDNDDETEDADPSI